MADDASLLSTSSTNAVVGIRSDIYERHLELIWMTKDDIENFEARMEDKTLFQNLALCSFSAAIPIGIRKIY